MKFPEFLDKLEPYEPERRSEIYLALNENPYAFPQELMGEVFSRIDPDILRTYHESPNDALLSALSRYVGLPSSRIGVGSGADEILYYIFLMFPDRKFVVCPPTYSCYYLFARSTRARLVEVPLVGETYEKLNLDALGEKLDGESVLLIPNPNNPTGCLFGVAELEYLVRTGALIVVDEAYYEFSGATFAGMMDEFENLVVVRTLSKAFSLASQRVGYLLASEEFVKRYNAIRLPYNVSYVSQLFATVALERADLFLRRVRRIVDERERMKAGLSEMGIRTTDSRANFVFLPLGEEVSKNLFETLLGNGVTVRRFREGLRISVGMSEENDLVISVVSEFFGREGAKV